MKILEKSQLVGLRMLTVRAIEFVRAPDVRRNALAGLLRAPNPKSRDISLGPPPTENKLRL